MQQQYNFRFYRTSAKADFILPQHLTDILIGLMLGDLHAERKTVRNNTRLQFHQTINHNEYIEHLYDLFTDYVGTQPKTYVSSGGLPHMKDKTYKSLKFYTYSLPCFNIFRVYFYDDNGVKIIPLNLKILLTSQSLSYWFIDDGYKTNNEFVFCTESYTFAENQELVSILKMKFNLNCSIRSHTNGYRLHVLRSSKDKFIDLVKPYVIPHFYYKIGLNIPPFNYFKLKV